LTVFSKINITRSDVQTLTTTKYETAEIGIQTSFSKIKPDDIQEDDEKTRLYTGFPNYDLLFGSVILFSS
jgi:hypothetical protein